MSESSSESPDSVSESSSPDTGPAPRPHNPPNFLELDLNVSGLMPPISPIPLLTPPSLLSMRVPPSSNPRTLLDTLSSSSTGQSVPLLPSLPPYLTRPNISVDLDLDLALDESDDSERDETGGPPGGANIARLIRARRNQVVLDALMGIMEQNEERMLRYVMDQSYHESLEQKSLDMQRTLSEGKKEYEALVTDCHICMICQDDFELHDIVADISCKHVLHFGCLEEWIKRNPVCPFCEDDLSVSSEPPQKRHRTAMSLLEADPPEVEEAC